MPDEEKLEGQTCPLCGQNTLILIQEEIDIPFFGHTYVFSMNCSNCRYHKSDVEAEEAKEPARFSYDISSEEDMKVRVVKSSSGTVKVPYIGDIIPGPASEGYVTNIEGIFQRIKERVEHLRDSEEDEEQVKKAKNLLKKITKIMWGQEKAKLIIEDPTGNSAIISDKTEKTPLKVKSD
ncbi:MAG TPA: ZPR1 zinc finger domain-containing protein [Candidatus Nanoarchaeia archaeon]|nr:ZPR1 zinc finger domain-containing protein [Candidatus Nanoarchaeia archaeon]